MPITNRRPAKPPVNKYEVKYFSAGFRKVFAPETKMPQMKARLSHLSAAELSNESSLYAAWREYAEDIVRALNVQVVTAQMEYDYTYAKKLVMMKATSVTEKKLKVDIDPDVMAAYKDLINVQVERDMYASKVESFTNCLAILSREVTLRSNHP